MGVRFIVWHGKVTHCPTASVISGEAVESGYKESKLRAFQAQHAQVPYRGVPPYPRIAQQSHNLGTSGRGREGHKPQNWSRVLTVCAADVGMHLTMPQTFGSWTGFRMLNNGLNLRQKFAGEGEDAPGSLAQYVDRLEYGDGEGGGFTRARLSLGDDISIGERHAAGLRRVFQSLNGLRCQRMRYD